SFIIDEKSQSVKINSVYDRANITENTNIIVSEKPNQTSSQPNPTVRRRYTPLEVQEAANQMKKAFNMLKNVIIKRIRDNEDGDEYDLFSKMLAKKIRKLPEHERNVFTYEIEGIYINKLRKINSFSTHSITSSTEKFDPPFTTYSTPTYQSRPPSNLSAYSESICPTNSSNFDQSHLNKNILNDKQKTHIKSENYNHRPNEENIKMELFQ
ncbi:Hypothetical protein CINCED_3A005888, partial [Cinara cedri]